MWNIFRNVDCFYINQRSTPWLRYATENFEYSTTTLIKNNVKMVTPLKI